jgi:hypothetical protein
MPKEKPKPAPPKDTKNVYEEADKVQFRSWFKKAREVVPRISVWDGIEEDDDQSGDGNGDDHDGDGRGSSSDVGSDNKTKKKKRVDMCKELQLDLGGDELMDAVEELLSDPPEPIPPPPPPPADTTSTTNTTNLPSPTITLSGKKITTLSLPDLHREKKCLKRRLQRYDADFINRFGRSPQKDDKEPIRGLYEIYNVIKERIALLELEELGGVGESGNVEAAALAAATSGNTAAAAGAVGGKRRGKQLSDLVRIVEEDDDEFSRSSSDCDENDVLDNEVNNYCIGITPCHIPLR